MLLLIYLNGRAYSAGYATALQSGAIAVLAQCPFLVFSIGMGYGVPGRRGTHFSLLSRGGKALPPGVNGRHPSVRTAGFLS